MALPRPSAAFKKDNQDHFTVLRTHYFRPSTAMGEYFTTRTAPASLPGATETPRAPDQQQNLESQFRRSVPLIIFITATIAGIFIIIVLGLLFLKRRKKRRREKKQVEHHEQWLARQNLDREEERARRMAVGGYLGRVQGVHGRDFATHGRRDSGVELRTMVRQT